MLEQQATDILQMGGHARIIAMGAIVVFAYLTDFLCCRFIVPLVRKVAHRTVFKWDNYLTEGKALDYAFHLIPPLLFLITIPLLFPDPALWKRLVLRGLYIYLIAVSCGLVCEFISSIYAISSETEALRNKPLKGIYQMLKVAVVCVGVILIIGVLVDKDFTALIAGLGASAAVLMLIFKDTILGVVAGVQLSAYDMLRPGDWIMLEKYDINGEVEEVNMNTVKVRNWDNTITTIPPYTLVSDSFKNWRGMRESGGRRVAKRLLQELERNARKRRPQGGEGREHRHELDKILHRRRTLPLRRGRMGRESGNGREDRQSQVVPRRDRALPAQPRQRERRSHAAGPAA